MCTILSMVSFISFYSRLCISYHTEAKDQHFHVLCECKQGRPGNKDTLKIRPKNLQFQCFSGTQHAPRPLVAKQPAGYFFLLFSASNLFPKLRNLVSPWTFLGCSPLCPWQQCHQWVLSASSREYWYSWLRPLPWRAPISSQWGELSVWVGKMPVGSIHHFLTTYRNSLCTVLQEYCQEYISEVLSPNTRLASM